MEKSAIALAPWVSFPIVVEFDVPVFMENGALISGYTRRSCASSAEFTICTWTVKDAPGETLEGADRTLI